MRSPVRWHPSILVTITLLYAQSVLAFETPLSDESVREAYFLGQRHDGSLEGLLEKYTHQLQPPKSGPYISSIMFLTPFMRAAQLSSSHTGNYSAQQAALDHHRETGEIVQVLVEIRLTESYGQIVGTVPANPRTATGEGLILRQGDFWKAFQVEVHNGERAVPISASDGHANYNCSDGGCSLVGATLKFELPAAAFSADSAVITINPPEGEPVSTAFDLGSLH
jgi:hypothetical protein